MTRCTNPILSILLGSTLMLAQACDQSPGGEKIAAKPDHGQNAVEVDVKKNEPAATPTVDEKLTSGDAAPALPPPIGRPGDEIPNNGPGYGGGSQGALEPVRTGDEDDEEDDDFGICGNGEQEVLRTTNKDCPHLLYGTTIAEDLTSTLVYLNPGTGQGFNIATITGINDVSAIDFSPEGYLYGVGKRSVSPFDSVFAQIDCQTGVAAIIGPTRLSGGMPVYEITDIDFDSDGQLWAYLIDDQYVGNINVATGEFTAVSVTDIEGNTQGFGLATFPFPNDQLYVAGNANLVLINENDGTGTTIRPLIFPSLSDPRITGMDNDPLENILYVAITSSTQNNLGVLDIATGDVSLIGTNPVPAPSGLDGLAVNRRYEECDTSSVGDVDPGTACINCDLVETNCADGIDNDFNGLTDCDDPNCLNQPCNDSDACTLNDVCTAIVIDEQFVELVCQGTDVVCNDENPCTIDTCDTGTCVFRNDQNKTILGSCEEDGRACTVGKCAVNPNNVDGPFICFETDRKFVTGPLGCLDANQCTADSCVESWTEEGHTSNGDVNISAVPWGQPPFQYDAIGNVILDNDWQCETEAMPQTPCLDPVSCRDGSCTIAGTGMPGDPANIQCLPDAPRPCMTDADCLAGDLEICLLGICAVESCVENRRIIFVTSTTHTGNFNTGLTLLAHGGLDGADAICRSLAITAGLPGASLPLSYKAWLSDSTATADSRISHSPFPYVRPDGRMVAKDYAHLVSTGFTSPTLINPINVDQNGVTLSSNPSSPPVWTGTNPDGKTTGSPLNCNNWTSASSSVFGQLGIYQSTQAFWTYDGNFPCDFVLHLYCLQQ